MTKAESYVGYPQFSFSRFRNRNLPIYTALVAFFISFFTSMAGVSGAFLLLPFQMSVLGLATPAVSATNLVFKNTETYPRALGKNFAG
jgi:uncharacterized membrane protein YfcA